MKKQVVSEPSKWLYQDTEQGRNFCKTLYMPDGVEDWSECTDEEKTAWERAHRPQEPEREAAPNQIEDVEVVQ